MRKKFFLQCIGCGATYDPHEVIYVCGKCGDLLSVVYNYDQLPRKLKRLWNSRALSVWRYKEVLPIEDYSKVVTLNEGGTGLYRCHKLAKALEINVRQEETRSHGGCIADVLNHLPEGDVFGQN